MLPLGKQTADVADRPFNNLLRRLNSADYALLAPHLTSDEAKPGELLYNPGDNVQTVHFPCGPMLVSYMSIRLVTTVMGSTSAGGKLCARKIFAAASLP